MSELRNVRRIVVTWLFGFLTVAFSEMQDWMLRSAENSNNLSIFETKVRICQSEHCDSPEDLSPPF